MKGANRKACGRRNNEPGQRRGFNFKDRPVKVGRCERKEIIKIIFPAFTAHTSESAFGESFPRRELNFAASSSF